jgi:outer membrane biosynthesis protein TonB
LFKPPIISPATELRPEPAPSIGSANPSPDDGIDRLGLLEGFEGGNFRAGIGPPDPPRPAERPIIGPQQASEGVIKAMLLYRVQPQYPEAAKIMGISGPMKLCAILSADGHIRELTVMSGNPILARAAVGE